MHGAFPNFLPVRRRSRTSRRVQSTVIAPSAKPVLPGVIQTAPSPSIIPLSRTKTVSKVEPATTSRRRGLKTVSFAATSCSRLRIVRLALRVIDKG